MKKACFAKGSFIKGHLMAITDGNAMPAPNYTEDRHLDSQSAFDIYEQ